MHLALFSSLALGVGVALAQRPTVSTISRDLARVESVRQIKDITRGLVQLLQFGRFSDAATLFSASSGTLVWGHARKEEDAAAQQVTGASAIEAWLRKDVGSMDGVKAGSMNLWCVETPVVTLSEDGTSAKARWNVLRFLGDGQGATRIDGGVWENDYVLEGNQTWRIATLHHYEMYTGDWVQGWHNSGLGNRTLPIVPYHFTPDQAGIPIIVPGNETVPGGDNRPTTNELAVIAARIGLLNDEDEVRNLQHMFGYYIDRRMWPDVEDLFAADGTIKIDGAVVAINAAGIRVAMESLWGPEGLSQGILNEHPMLETIVDIVSDTEAVVRGMQLGMVGDSNKKTATWEFSVYRNTFAKDPDTGIWKIRTVDLNNVLVADYAVGWGMGGINSASTLRAPLTFIDTNRPARNHGRIVQRMNSSSPTSVDLIDLQRRLSRSAAFDSSENDSSAYGYWADDIRCDYLGAIHAAAGHKESPGTGWFATDDRIAKACHARYGAYGADPMRGSVPFHWKLQMVVRVSSDGRSASYRSRLLQFGTGTNSGSSFGGGMYSDQTVLDTESGKWKLWSTTIDEFYWSSGSWAAGWAGVTRANNSSTRSSSSSAGTATTTATSTTTGSSSWHNSTTTRMTSSSSATARPSSPLDAYPPDVPNSDPLMHPRENGFEGGPITATRWPSIQTMWWPFRNPVSGRVPGGVVIASPNATGPMLGGEGYWPGCVPCQPWGPRPEWALRHNGYQEPSTGPTNVTANVTVRTVMDGTNESRLVVAIDVKVQGGPGEPVGRHGLVELWMDGPATGAAGIQLDQSLVEELDGMARFELGVAELRALTGGDSVRLVAKFRRSDVLLEGKTVVSFKLPD